MQGRCTSAEVGRKSSLHLAFLFAPRQTFANHTRLRLRVPLAPWQTNHHPQRSAGKYFGTIHGVYTDFASSFTGDFVTIVVGGGNGIVAETFTAHESLLCESSPFFRAALEKQWKESMEKKIYLPEDDPAVLNACLQWLYGHMIQFSAMNSKPRDEWTTQDASDAHYFLAKCYVFGEKMQQDGFCNDAISAILHLVDEGCKGSDGTSKVKIFPSHGAICAIYNGTSRDSPARKMMVHLYTFYGHKGFLSNLPNDEKAHYPFILDLALAMLPVTSCHNTDSRTAWPSRERWFKKPS